MLDHIYQMLLQLPHDENGVVYFEEPLKVLRPGAIPDINLWAACPTPEGEVMVMDVNKEWQIVQETDADALVMEELLHKLHKLVQTINNPKLQEVSL